VSTPLRFALIGAAGFVAPRHLQAIKDVGGKLVAALDPHDAVGVLDRFDFETEFFTEPERFERHLEKLRREGNGIDWLAVCSPNYLHDTHIRLGLRVGARVICEKPLVLDPKNLDALADIEKEYAAIGETIVGYVPHNRHVFTVLQLRHSEEMNKLRAQVATGHHHVNLLYSTPRGRWYDRSWKGDKAKSGGIITNIGIHMLDLLLWLFGPVTKIGEIRVFEKHHAAGHIVLERANVNWDLSIDSAHRPERALSMGGTTWSIGDFENLHSTVYRETLAGRGHGIEDARPAVELAYRLRR
jgi:UDP-N-acetyl-2-amino-2-deoxyglucuronate dehydrogenase